MIKAASLKHISKHVLQHVDFENAIFVIFAFLIGHSSFPGGFMPFALPFFAALSGSIAKNAAVAISLLIGVLSAGGPGKVLITAGSILLYSTINKFWVRKSESHENAKKLQIAAITGFVSSVAIGMLPVFAGDFLLYDFLKVILQGVMVIVLIPVMKNALIFYEDYKNNGAGALKNNERLISAIIVFVIALSAFSDLNIFGLHIRNMIYIIVILTAGYIAGP